MLLVAVVVITPAACLLVVTLRCALWTSGLCVSDPGYREWIEAMLPVLIAVVMKGDRDG